ncbi:HTH-type transcriptional activator RhaS [Providencia rettgeri]
MKLYSEDFFITPQQHITVEPRVPQPIFPEHTHDFSEIFLVTQGIGLHVLNGRPYTLCPGMVCYIKSCDYHLFDNVSNLNLTNVLYRSDSSFTYLNNISHFFPTDAEKNISHWLLNKEHYNKAQQIIDKLNESDGSDLAYTESLFLQLIVNLQDGRYNHIGEGNNEQRIIQMLRWLNMNFTEDVDWGHLTTQFSVSLRTFHRYMKNNLGISPQNYLIKLRLSEAYYQIRFSDKSITDIALESGFNDSAYFSTCFKSEYNFTPRDLRHCSN